MKSDTLPAFFLHIYSNIFDFDFDFVPSDENKCQALFAFSISPCSRLTDLTSVINTAASWLGKSITKSQLASSLQNYWFPLNVTWVVLTAVLLLWNRLRGKMSTSNALATVSTIIRMESMHGTVVPLFSVKLDWVDCYVSAQRLCWQAFDFSSCEF